MAKRKELLHTHRGISSATMEYQVAIARKARVGPACPGCGRDAFSRKPNPAMKCLSYGYLIIMTTDDSDDDDDE